MSSSRCAAGSAGGRLGRTGDGAGSGAGASAIRAAGAISPADPTARHAVALTSLRLIG
ncbi:hypothetical protein [Plastoroseomonas hellenica]|uniref:hypothetical protein n=1 Tax=Plastoroseomonas hellenica TaxID=2687306 RepID=UPI001BA478C0|nr:hypothetical protein [Plastoroseomonas hellenica]MBR0646905.1 hypothetical protein [Plastoroseomonas hellenica]